MGVGKAADPEILRRRLEGEMAVRAADAMGEGSEGWVERRRL